MKGVVLPRPPGISQSRFAYRENRGIRKRAQDIESLRTAALPIGRRASPERRGVRYKYRYLDLRREFGTRNNLIVRHKFNATVREFLNNEGFIDIRDTVFDGQHP